MATISCSFMSSSMHAASVGAQITLNNQTKISGKREGLRERERGKEKRGERETFSLSSCKNNCKSFLLWPFQLHHSSTTAVQRERASKRELKFERVTTILLTQQHNSCARGERELEFERVTLISQPRLELTRRSLEKGFYVFCIRLCACVCVRAAAIVSCCCFYLRLTSCSALSAP